jgi:uncharacterized lipoprotein YddW (UPF0748 family)
MRVSSSSNRPRSFVVLRLAVAVALLLCGAVRAQSTSTIPPASPDGVAQAVVRRAGLEGRVLWLDGTANLQRLSTREGVATIMDRCKRANINTVVVDVKPLSGHVLYNSKVAPRIPEWRGFQYPEGYDLLRVAIAEGRKRSLKIYANVNVFSDGHKYFRAGPVYEKPEQQSVIYDVERSVTNPRGMRTKVDIGVNRTPSDEGIAVFDSGYTQPKQIDGSEVYALVTQDQVQTVAEGAFAPRGGIKIPKDSYLLIGRGAGGRWLLQNLKTLDQLTWRASDRMIPIIDAPSETIAAFVNPANPTSREYELKIVDELASNYDFDGIVFDRMRYASLQSDFSELSRQKFEEYIGQKLDRFPGDIYSFDPSPGRPLVWGPYFKQWLEWRARNIRTWLQDASRIVRTKRPKSRIGVYVGSWYNTYYTVGVNWGSDEFAPGLDWMSPSYNQTGYAGLVDWITTGCYHPVATREQAKNAGLDDSFTVQAAAELSAKAVGDVAFVYAGLYVLDYRGSPEAFREAMQAAREYSHGVMLFDLMHIEEYGWWNVLEDEFRDPKTAPHDVPELLAAVRELRKALSASNRYSLPN